MPNKLNSFEEQLKKAAEGHSVSYDANQWAKMEQKLNLTSEALPRWVKLGIASMVLCVVGYGVFNIWNHETVNQSVLVKNEVSVVADETLEYEKPVATETLETVVSPVIDLGNDGLVSPELVGEETIKKVEGVHTLLIKENVIMEEEDVPLTQKIAALDAVSVEVEPAKIELPKVIIANTDVCAGVEVTASLSIATLGAVIWHVGNGVTQESTNFTYVYLEPGDYDLKAFIAETGTFTETQIITIKPKPDASFSIRNNLDRGMVPVAYISANTSGEKSYSWSLGDGTVLKGEGISHTYRKAGDYEVSLRVLNKYGCFWTNYQRVRVEKEFNLLAPNSFSPNGDGVNDEWIPVALTSGYYNFELMIYDRNNHLVFETKDSEYAFDGKSHGEIASSGDVFIWKAITIDPNGVRQEYGGTVISVY